MTAAASQRLYPVAPAEGDDDPRFTFGLIFDVALVIEDYGYPPIRSGLNFTLSIPLASSASFTSLLRSSMS